MTLWMPQVRIFSELNSSPISTSIRRFKMSRKRNFETESARRLAHRALAAYVCRRNYHALCGFCESGRDAGLRYRGTVPPVWHELRADCPQADDAAEAGQERISFLPIRVDVAGNFSKRLHSGNLPFARHGGGCPLWSVHQVFTTPRRVVTQWLELPDGQRFFSIARTVSSGGGRLRGAARRACHCPRL